MDETKSIDELLRHKYVWTKGTYASELAKAHSKQTDVTSSQKVPLSNLRKLAKGTSRMPLKPIENHTILLARAKANDPNQPGDHRKSQNWIKLFQV